MIIQFVMHGHASRYRPPARTVHGMIGRRESLCGRKPRDTMHVVTPADEPDAPAVTCRDCDRIIRRALAELEVDDAH